MMPLTLCFRTRWLPYGCPGPPRKCLIVALVVAETLVDFVLHVVADVVVPRSQVAQDDQVVNQTQSTST